MTRRPSWRYRHYHLPLRHRRHLHLTFPYMHLTFSSTSSQTDSADYEQFLENVPLLSQARDIPSRDTTTTIP